MFLIEKETQVCHFQIFLAIWKNICQRKLFIWYHRYQNNSFLGLFCAQSNHWTKDEEEVSYMFMLFGFMFPIIFVMVFGMIIFQFVELIQTREELKGALLDSPNGSIVRPAELHSPSAEKTARPRMFRHFVPSRELHSLAPLMRLSLVDLPSANSIKCCSPPASKNTA